MKLCNITQSGSDLEDLFSLQIKNIMGLDVGVYDNMASTTKCGKLLQKNELIGPSAKVDRHRSAYIQEVSRRLPLPLRVVINATNIWGDVTTTAICPVTSCVLNVNASQSIVGDISIFSSSNATTSSELAIATPSAVGNVRSTYSHWLSDYSSSRAAYAGYRPALSSTPPYTLDISEITGDVELIHNVTFCESCRWKPIFLAPRIPVINTIHVRGSFKVYAATPLPITLRNWPNPFPYNMTMDVQFHAPYLASISSNVTIDSCPEVVSVQNSSESVRLALSLHLLANFPALAATRNLAVRCATANFTKLQAISSNVEIATRTVGTSLLMPAMKTIGGSVGILLDYSLLIDYCHYSNRNYPFRFVNITSASDTTVQGDLHMTSTSLGASWPENFDLAPVSPFLVCRYHSAQFYFCMPVLKLYTPPCMKCLISKLSSLVSKSNIQCLMSIVLYAPAYYLVFVVLSHPPAHSLL